jgi:hypothetical protein
VVAGEALGGPPVGLALEGWEHRFFLSDMYMGELKANDVCVGSGEGGESSNGSFLTWM